MPLDLSLPFRPRSPLPPNSAFGPRKLYGDNHTGVDMNGYTNAHAGAAVPAAGSGTVIESYNGNIPKAQKSWKPTEKQHKWERLRGTMVVIDHGVDADGVRWVSRYHMLVANSNIAKGSKVDAGDTIGRVGNSGTSGTGAHLHFELLRNGVPVDPLKYLQYTGSPSVATAKHFDNSTPAVEPKQEDNTMRIYSNSDENGQCYLIRGDAECVPVSDPIEAKHLAISLHGKEEAIKVNGYEMNWLKAHAAGHAEFLMKARTTEAPTIDYTALAKAFADIAVPGAPVDYAAIARAAADESDRRARERLKN